MLLSVGIGLGCNANDINDAKNKLGNEAMFEEIAKTSLMYAAGFKLLAKGIKMANQFGTAVSIHVPKGGFYLKAGMTGASLATPFLLKPVVNSLWVTNYEKYKAKPAS